MLELLPDTHFVREPQRRLHETLDRDGAPAPSPFVDVAEPNHNLHVAAHLVSRNTRASGSRNRGIATKRTEWSIAPPLLMRRSALLPLLLSELESVAERLGGPSRGVYAGGDGGSGSCCAARGPDERAAGN